MEIKVDLGTFLIIEDKKLYYDNQIFLYKNGLLNDLHSHEEFIKKIIENHKKESLNNSPVSNKAN